MKKSFMKKIKRVAATGLALATMMGTLSACGGGSGSSTDAGNTEASTGSSSTEGGNGSSAFSLINPEDGKRDTLTLTVFSERANYSGLQEGWSAKLMKDLFNVELNIVPNAEGAFNTRMESGTMGDIVVFGSEADYMQARDAGLLFDWEEDNTLADYGPYIKEHMSYALEKNRNMSSDGKIYGLGYEVATNSKDLQSFFYTWDIRWDLYAKLGYPEVKNLDDLLNLFIEMKKICPTDDNGKPTYAASLWPDWDGDMVMYVKSTATAYYGYDEFGVGLYDPSTGTFHGALDDNSPYLQMLDFYHKLYANDLLDPDSMTTTYDTMIQKVKSSGTFFSIFNYAGCLAYNTAEHMESGRMMRSLTPSDASPIVYGLNVLGSNNYWAIGANCEYPEVSMEIINYLCTPAGRMNFEYGPQGITWDYDEDGNTYFTELGKKTNSDGSTVLEGGGFSGTFKDGQLQINMTTWSIDASNPDSNGETYNDESWKSNISEPLCDVDKDWREKTGCTTTNEYMLKGKYMVSPGSAYVLPIRSDELKTTWAQVTKCIRENSWKAIYTKTDEEFTSVVNAMKAQAKGFGYQECWDWSNEQAKARKAAEDAASN